MFRANIYSLEALNPVAREAVHDGVGIVATLMGQTAVANEVRVKLHMNQDGTVNPARVGLGKLDKMVELHLMAVPVDPGESEILGKSAVGGGFAFTNISEDNSQIIRTTTAHEVSHAFGFVMPDSPQSNPESKYHCCSQDCIMHRYALYNLIESESSEPSSTKKRRLASLMPRRRKDQAMAEPVLTKQYHQYDFCQECKIDMHTQGERNLAELRHNRITKKHAFTRFK